MSGAWPQILYALHTHQLLSYKAPHYLFASDAYVRVIDNPISKLVLEESARIIKSPSTEHQHQW